jgi:hypothetical protein
VTAQRTLFLCLRGVGYKHTVHTCRVSIFSLAIDRHTSLFVVAHIARSIVNHNSFEEDMQNSKTTIGRSHIASYFSVFGRLESSGTTSIDFCFQWPPIAALTILEGFAMYCLRSCTWGRAHKEPTSYHVLCYSRSQEIRVRKLIESELPQFVITTKLKAA